MQSLLQIAFSAVALLIPSHHEGARAQHHLLARVHGPVQVLARPAGSALATLGARTMFGSARVLSVVGRDGRWLHVATADLPSGRDGWIDAGASGVTLGSTRISIMIRLGARTLELRRDSRLVRRFTVGVGAPSSPTPTGRFAVTDKLRGAAYSPVYGCCILALSARQTHLPAGWTGCDRIAIHGTNAPATIGRALSTGCVHADDAALRYLMARVPLGTPVTILR
jgi:L,D-transpeptidase catalytic domain